MRLGKYLSSLNKPELEELIAICNFTEEENVVVECLIKNRSYEEIAAVIKCSTATVGRRIAAIKYKVDGSDLNMKNRVPIWEKINISIEEAAEYSNIGINKLYEMVNNPSCPFVLYVGQKKLIKRKEFERYIEKASKV